MICLQWNRLKIYENPDYAYGFCFFVTSTSAIYLLYSINQSNTLQAYRPKNEGDPYNMYTSYVP